MKPFPSSPAQYQRQPENRFRTFQAAFGLDNSDNAPCLHVAVCFSDCLNLHKLQDWQSPNPPAGIRPAFSPSAHSRAK
ncbi:hypothetical protein [Kingella oralis]|uniref:hypothetical protein n=1 Tax=Kingella oralis TaxID=505 RepID=UPI0034E37994